MSEKNQSTQMESMSYDGICVERLDAWQKKFVVLYAERLRDKGTIEQLISGEGLALFVLPEVYMCLQYAAEIIARADNPAFIEALDLMEPICQIRTAIEMASLERSSLHKTETQQASKQKGFIYIAKSEGNPGMLKIGMTTKAVAFRIKQLSNSTTSVHPFVLVESFPCENPRDIERNIHAELGAYRVHGGREFFAISEFDAIAACKRITGGAA